MPQQFAFIGVSPISRATTRAVKAYRAGRKQGRMAAAKPRVLVVEDDQESYNALSKILKHVGYDTLGAPTLAEGMTLLDKSPRFVILDLVLPDGNGKDLLKHIREQKLPIKVAIITGTADKEMLDETRVL